MPIPNDIRLMNRRQVLLASLKSGPATRSTLSRATGISATTIGKIIEELVGDGVLRSATAVGQSPGGPGRPGYLVKINDVHPRFLGVRLGPTHTRLTPLAVAPVSQDDWAETIPTAGSLDEWVAGVRSASRTLVSRKPPSCVLVSLPGVLDGRTGRSVLSPNVPWMVGREVATELGKAMNLPALAVQEIQCLALGHRIANPAADDFLLVDFGFGIGSAALVRGQLFHGPRDFAGEIGHTPVPGNTTPCSCGGIGCLETIAGRRQLFGAEHADNDAEALSPDELATLTRPRAANRVRAALRAAGFTIASAMNALGLDHAVVTGFVTGLPRDDLVALERAVAASATASRFGPVRIDAAPRHRLAGLAGLGIDRLVVPV